MSYEAVHFSCLCVHCGGIFNFPLELCLWIHNIVNCLSQGSWLSAYPGFQKIFLAFLAFDLKLETLTSLKQLETIGRLLTGLVPTMLCVCGGGGMLRELARLIKLLFYVLWYETRCSTRQGTNTRDQWSQITTEAVIIKVWNIVRTTKMWHGDNEWRMPATGKMTLTELLGAGSPQTFHLQHPPGVVMTGENVMSMWLINHYLCYLFCAPRCPWS